MSEKPHRPAAQKLNEKEKKNESIQYFPLAIGLPSWHDLRNNLFLNINLINETPCSNTPNGQEQAQVALQVMKINGIHKKKDEFSLITEACKSFQK